MAEVKGTAKSNDENIPHSRKSLTIEHRNIKLSTGQLSVCFDLAVSVRLGNKPVDQSSAKDIS
jgi:hypothetical protein